MKKLVLALAIGSAFFAVSTQAAVTSAQAVTTVQVLSSGNVIFTLSGAPVNPASCANTGYLLVDSAVKKEWLATLLTAQASGSNVVLNIFDGACEGNNPRITGIRIVS